MNLIVRVFGYEVLNVSTDTETIEEYDEAGALSGGTLGIAGEVYAGDADAFMGFTNGRSCE